MPRFSLFRFASKCAPAGRASRPGLGALCLTGALLLGGCSAPAAPEPSPKPVPSPDATAPANETAEDDTPTDTAADAPADTPAKLPDDAPSASKKADEDREGTASNSKATEQKPAEEEEADPAALEITKDFRESFDHGEKGAKYQRYIVLHDTEGNGSARETIDWWDSNGNLVAAHFIVNKDGSIWQCVPLDRIAHHAGFGDTGHNAQYGVPNESRDDKEGTTSIGSDYADYGMNSYSVGIEMVHVGGEGDYPEAQLEAVDRLIAYIDDYYGFESTIIDHKAWRSGNSDTSAEFAPYLKSYQEKRTHE